MPGEPAIGDEDRIRRQRLVQLAAEARHVHRPVARIEPRRGIVFPGLHARRDLGDIVGPRRAGGRTAIGQRIGEVFEPGARIAPQRDLGRDATLRWLAAWRSSSPERTHAADATPILCGIKSTGSRKPCHSECEAARYRWPVTFSIRI